MKKIFAMAVLAAALGFSSPCFAQDTTHHDGTVKKVEKGIGKGAKKEGNETAELATKGKAKVTDKKSDEWVGPEGQTIYVDDGSKYYWINEKGGRVFVSREQLKTKQK